MVENPKRKYVDYENHVFREGHEYETQAFVPKVDKSKGWYWKHLGNDIICKYKHNNGKVKTNATVISPADGVVLSTGYSSSAGYYIEIRHTKTIVSKFCHLKKGSIVVKKGQQIRKCDKLAIEDSSGNSSAPHLHYAILVNNKYVDPYDYLMGTKSYNDELPPTGDYKVISPRYVRTGAGTEYRIKKVYELTQDGQRNCVNTKKSANAQYKQGTIFTAKRIVVAKNGSIWAETPSGFVCLVSSKGTMYCSKV